MFDDKNLPPGLEQDDWDDFVVHRKEIGKPMTDTAKRRMLMKLYRMMEAGEPISQCMERAMVNGWQDVYPMPPELRESKAQAHQDAKKQDVPEVDEETARENVRYLHDALNGTMKITGGGR